ncbi:MAG: carbonic anhydrase [Melioribacteraceae bacterium]
MKTGKRTIALFIAVLSITTIAQTNQGVHSQSALQKLADGNKRFAESKAEHINQSAERRTEVAKGQKPFAVIVTCSDSRVPPEIIFDQGLGDLFVIRTAGNIVDDIGLGSIEYAVEHLGVRLIMVLGHEKCGAVDAAVKGGHAEGHIQKLIDEIIPAVEKAKNIKGDLLDNSVKTNVLRIVDQLNSSEPILKEFVHEKKLTVVGARYDLDDSVVAILH